MFFNTFDFSIKDQIAKIIFKENNISPISVINEMDEVLNDIQWKGEEITFLIIEGVFYPLNWLSIDDEEIAIFSKKFAKILRQIASLSYPVLTKVSKCVYSFGIGLCSVSDYSFTDEDTTFQIEEIEEGIIPSILVIYLQRKMGTAKTNRFLFSRQRITALDAQNLGLIDEVFNSQSLEPMVSKIIDYLLMVDKEMFSRNKEILLKTLPIPPLDLEEYAIMLFSDSIKRRKRIK